jgi:hypothetical protein
MGFLEDEIAKIRANEDRIKRYKEHLKNNPQPQEPKQDNNTTSFDLSKAFDTVSNYFTDDTNQTQEQPKDDTPYFQGMLSNGDSDRITRIKEANQGKTSDAIKQAFSDAVWGDSIPAKIYRGLAESGTRTKALANIFDNHQGATLLSTVANALTDTKGSLAPDIIDDKKLAQDMQNLEEIKEKTSQKGLSEEELKEINELQKKSANAKTLSENIEVGAESFIDVVTNPHRWTTQGITAGLTDFLNLFSAGAGKIAGEFVKEHGLNKAIAIAGGIGAGATEGAVINSLGEYAVAKGQGKSDEEAQKIAIQSATGGAIAGGGFGALGGIDGYNSTNPSLEQQVANTINQEVENTTLIPQQQVIANTVEVQPQTIQANLNRPLTNDEATKIVNDHQSQQVANQESTYIDDLAKEPENFDQWLEQNKAKDTPIEEIVKETPKDTPVQELSPQAKEYLGLSDDTRDIHQKVEDLKVADFVNKDLGKRNAQLKELRSIKNDLATMLNDDENIANNEDVVKAIDNNDLQSAWIIADDIRKQSTPPLDPISQGFKSIADDMGVKLDIPNQPIKQEPTPKQNYFTPIQTKLQEEINTLARTNQHHQLLDAYNKEFDTPYNVDENIIGIDLIKEEAKINNKDNVNQDKNTIKDVSLVDNSQKKQIDFKNKIKENYINRRIKEEQKGVDNIADEDFKRNRQKILDEEGVNFYQEHFEKTLKLLTDSIENKDFKELNDKLINGGGFGDYAKVIKNNFGLDLIKGSKKNKEKELDRYFDGEFSKWKEEKHELFLTQRKKDELKSTIRYLEITKVDFDGKVLSKKDFLDEAFNNGYIYIDRIKKGTLSKWYS